MDWCIGVLVYFVPFLHRFIGENGTFCGGMPGGVKRGYLSECLARDKELLIYLAALLLSWFIGVLVYFVQFLHRFIGETGTL